MKAEGARSGTWLCRPLRRVARRKLRRSRIEMVDVNAIEAEIVDQHIAVVGRNGRAVRMRRSLAVGDRAMALVMKLRDSLAQFSRFVDVKRSGTPAGVIRAQ